MFVRAIAQVPVLVKVPPDKPVPHVTLVTVPVPATVAHVGIPQVVGDERMSATLFGSRQWSLLDPVCLRSPAITRFDTSLLEGTEPEYGKAAVP